MRKQTLERDSFYESIEKGSLLELEKRLVEDGSRDSTNKMGDIFLETASEEPKQDLENGQEEYNDNRRSDHAKRIDERIEQIRELLATKSKRSFEKLTVEQASLIRAASHYWLDERDGRLYKKNAGNNSLQLVVAEEDWMRWDTEAAMLPINCFSRDSGGQKQKKMPCSMLEPTTYVKLDKEGLWNYHQQ